MTPPPTPADPGPVDPDVELASAHLDGEAGPDERVRSGDPAVQAQITAFSSVVDQVRNVPPAPAGLLDEHVARTMRDFDTDTTVVPLNAHRNPWWERLPLGAVAAALVIVALVGAIGLASQATDDGDDTATASLDSADDSGDSGDSAGGGSEGAEDTAADGTDDAATMESEADLGSPAPRAAYDGYDALADDLRAELDGSRSTEAVPPPTPSSAETTTDGDGAVGQDPCGAVDLLGLDPATVVLVRTVLVTPDEVTAVVHDPPDGRRLVVVDQTCTVVLDRLL